MIGICETSMAVHVSKLCIHNNVRCSHHADYEHVVPESQSVPRWQTIVSSRLTFDFHSPLLKLDASCCAALTDVNADFKRQKTSTV